MATYNMVTMGEVETGNVHAGVEHLYEHVNVPACGSERADNLCLAPVEINSLKDVLEADVAGVGTTCVSLYHFRFVYLDYFLCKFPRI